MTDDGPAPDDDLARDDELVPADLHPAAAEARRGLVQDLLDDGADPDEVRAAAAWRSRSTPTRRGRSATPVNGHLADAVGLLVRAQSVNQLMGVELDDEQISDGR